MRLTKRRLMTLVGGLLTVALTMLGVTAATGSAQASTTRNFLVTLYGWPDNSPPGDAIAYPANGGYNTIHNVASGLGTYSNPITYATDQAELPIGTIVYYPYLHRYFIMEDDCTECDEDWTGQGPDGGPGLYHIDLWIGGQNAQSSNDVINCEDNLTQNSESVIINPPSTEPVDTTPLFNSSNDACYDPSSFPGGGGGGGGSGPGELISAQSGKCLDTYGGTFTDNTKEEIWTCHNGAGQTWTYSGGTINTDGGAYCLTVKGASTSRGAATILYKCNGGSNQQWSINSDGTITAPNTGFCLDVTGQATTNGTVVETWTCSGGANQQWSWS